MKIKQLKRLQTPCYLIDRERLIYNIENVNHAFKSLYDNFKIGYSFKTNTTPSIIKTCREHGCLSEVVSPFEVEVARMIGVPMNDVIYNGPCKDVDSVRSVIEAGGIVNVDSIDELTWIGENFPGSRIGLRMNICVTETSRFGIKDTEVKEAKALAERYGLKIVGLHCHTSHGRNLGVWSKKVTKMMKFTESFDELEFVDFGSNMYSDMEEELAHQFNERIPTMKEYAEIICGKMNARFVKPDSKPMLIIESGTPIVADAVSVVSKVVGIKEVRDKVFAFVDASKFDLGAICDVKNVPMEIVRCGYDGERRYYDIVGYSCMEDDVLNRRECVLCKGDYVIFKNVGAYSMSWANDFIKPKSMAYEKNGDEIRLVRKEGGYKDVYGAFETC